MARVSRKRKQEQAVEKLAVSRDEVYQCAVYIRLSILIILQCMRLF